jgi:hypothetical protein
MTQKSRPWKKKTPLAQGLDLTVIAQVILGEKSSAAEMDRKEAVHEVAAALTRSDFPQPGGP